MNALYQKVVAVATALVTISWSVGAQTIDIGPPDTAVCTGTPIDLTAALTGIATSVQPASYTLTDDTHTGVVDMGFSFTYYGQAYTQCVISSNSYVTFDLTQANNYSPWGIGQAAPYVMTPNNKVMFPYQDTNPGVGGTVSSVTCGIAPYRRFIVTFDQVAMFSCTGMLFTNQVIFFETTNHIEMHIAEKPLCAAWNSGAAIQGCDNPTGAVGDIVPGRNFPTQWSVTNDGYEFIPNGPGAYTMNAIPFNPAPVSTNNIVNWYDCNGNLLGTGLTMTVTPTTPCWYYAEWDYPCNLTPAEDSIFIDIGNVNITTNPSDATCFGYSDGTVAVDPVGSNFPVSMTISNQGSPTSIQQMNNISNVYTFNGIPAGTYDITVTDAVGCATTLAATVGEPTELLVDAGHYDILCAGETNGKAFATGSGSVPPYTFQWNDPFQQTTDTIGFLPVGAFTITITDSQGCFTDTTVIVSQPPPLVINITAGPDTCENKNGAVTAWITGGVHPYIYEWSAIRDSLHLFIQPQPNANGSNIGLSPGEYEVLVTDSNGCEIEGKGVVELIPSPVAQFMTRSKPEEFTKPEVQFVNESTGSVSWEWRFGDGQESNEEEPLHIYDYDGSYLVMLAAFNDPRYGCADTAWDYVEVDPYMTFYVPNAFTPEGNGVNDTWGPAGTNFQLESYNVKLFDRWGKLIWQTDNPKVRWDGKDPSSGTPLMAGNYTYIFTLKRKNTFEPKVISGTVTLYRKQY